jgi:hypothetical protein
MPVVNACLPGKLQQQPGLANAGLACHQRDATVPATGPFKQTTERRQLALTANEGRLLLPGDHRRP